MNGRRTLLLVAPESFYFSNPAGVPQLTGYLETQKIPVVQRVLDNYFYSHVCSGEILEQSFDQLEKLLPTAPEQLVALAALSLQFTGCAREWGLDNGSAPNLLKSLIRKRREAQKDIENTGRMLETKFLMLGRDRFMRALMKLQVALGLYCMPYWPYGFSVAEGASLPQRSSASVADAVRSPQNFLGPYYRNYVIPTLPADPLLCGISIAHPCQTTGAFTLACALKERFPGVHIVLGGPTVSALRDTYTAPGPLWEFYDSVVVGHGEAVLTALYNELASPQRDLARVEGLTWKDANNVIHAAIGHSSFDVAKIATPVFTDPRPRPILQVATSFGCDWAQCRFCAYPKFFSDAGGYFPRPIDRIVEDLRVLTEKYNPTYFHLTDSNLNSAHLGNLCDAIIRDGKHYPMHSFNRILPEFKKKDFCQKLKKAGFWGLQLGLESGSPRMLKVIRKGLTTDLASAAIKCLSEEGLILGVFVIAGFPTETEEDRELTVEFLRTHMPFMKSDIAISWFKVDKRSPIWHNPESLGVEVRPDPTQDLVLSFDYVTAEGTNILVAEKLSNEMNQKLGLPKYFWRHVATMLDYFYPEVREVSKRTD
jgi:radical SAM superfamily enzyme YgiQ (UPF0313 family)